MTQIREPVVAGAFYPGTRAALSDALSRLFGEPLRRPVLPRSAPIGLVVPHAGYVYSGAVAAVGYRALAAGGAPQWAIILGANHTGAGQPISLAREGAWRTPLGVAAIATAIADRLVGAGVPVAPEAFAHEHSIEVQLPFLQFLFGEEIPFVPICVMLPRIADLLALGKALAQMSRGSRGALIVSSDFTHYEPEQTARALDHRALERILALDAEGFYERLLRERLSICGGAAITALLAAARHLNWKADLVAYATSADAGADPGAVVGYAAASFEEETHG